MTYTISRPYKIDHYPQSLNIKFKKLHPDAKLPAYGKPGDNGLDLVAVSKEYKAYNGEKFAYIEMKTGVACEIPQGYVGIITHRGSVRNYSNLLSNAVGTIDSNFRGEITCCFKTIGSLPEYKVGDKIAQLLIIPCPQIEPEWVDELSETERGEKAFGSSGS